MFHPLGHETIYIFSSTPASPELHVKTREEATAYYRITIEYRIYGLKREKRVC